MTAPLTVDNVAVRYDDVVALDGVSLTLRAGTVTGLVGINGAGKSTLFQAIMGSVSLARGTVLIEGRPAREARRGARVSHMPQSETIDWSFPISVAETVMMGRYGTLGISRRPAARDRAAVADALARVELSDLADRQIGRLSGGQRKRAFLARALAQGSRLVLLDEPFAGVDPRSEALIVRIARELAESGSTVLVSTHDLHTLPQLADDVVVLRRRVLFHGSPADALTPERLSSAFGLDRDGGA